MPWQPLLRSPDRRWLAFYVFERSMLNQGYAPSPSGDLWVCDLTTGAAQRISVDTTPPNNLSDAERNNGDYGLFLSYATWSPDGRQIAWSDFIWSEGKPKRLLVHDVETAETRVLATLEGDILCGVDLAVDIDWGAGGIALRSVKPSATDVCVADEIVVLVYDADGTLLDRAPLPPTQEMLDNAFPVWVNQNGTPMLTFTIPNETGEDRYLLDPSTDAITPADQILALTPVDTTQDWMPPVYEDNWRTLLPGPQGKPLKSPCPHKSPTPLAARCSLSWARCRSSGSMAGCTCATNG
ncbi:MAG: PD40 domain-containing protein [Chloroflexi bacterium]|nr:PD40 domain-containing protein [Chloroflexota bacterium]